MPDPFDYESNRQATDLRIKMIAIFCVIVMVTVLTVTIILIFGSFLKGT